MASSDSARSSPHDMRDFSFVILRIAALAAHESHFLISRRRSGAYPRSLRGGIEFYLRTLRSARIHGTTLCATISVCSPKEPGPPVTLSSSTCVVLKSIRQCKTIIRQRCLVSRHLVEIGIFYSDAPPQNSLFNCEHFPSLSRAKLAQNPYIRSFTPWRDP